MNNVHAELVGSVGAPADRVYGLIADYRRHHPRILPSVFSDFAVEEGGVGAGTVLSFRINLGGIRHGCRARIEEPEPGRKLTETDLKTGAVTTFTVEPDGDASRVRIETDFPRSPGVKGWIERLFAPRMLRGIYREELDLLDRYARGVRLPA